MENSQEHPQDEVGKLFRELGLPYYQKDTTKISFKANQLFDAKVFRLDMLIAEALKNKNIFSFVALTQQLEAMLHEFYGEAKAYWEERRKIDDRYEEDLKKAKQMGDEEYADTLYQKFMDIYLLIKKYEGMRKRRQIIAEDVPVE